MYAVYPCYHPIHVMNKTPIDLINELALNYGAIIVVPKSQTREGKKSFEIIIPAKHWVGAIVHTQFLFPSVSVTDSLSLQLIDKNYVVDILPDELDNLLVNEVSDGDVVEFRFEDAPTLKLTVSR